jgi:hypothetical protein
MQAVEALEDLGNSIARQLDLGNQSSFEEVTEDLGEKISKILYRPII